MSYICYAHNCRAVQKMKRTPSVGQGCCKEAIAIAMASLQQH